MITVDELVRNKVWVQVGSKVENKEAGQAIDRVRYQVRYSLRGQVEDQVRALDEQVRLNCGSVGSPN